LAAILEIGTAAVAIEASNRLSKASELFAAAGKVYVRDYYEKTAAS
jgi:hypothetical protein